MSQSTGKPTYSIVASTRYKRDIKKLRKSGFKLMKLEGAIETLARGERLPERYKDHELKGDLQGIRGCHMAPDWLLLYKKEEGTLLLLLLRTGTHRDVLGIE